MPTLADAPHTRFLVLAVVLAPACVQAPESEEFRGYTTNVTLTAGDDGCNGGDDVVVDVNPQRSLFETSRAALSSFSMADTLSAIATNDGLPANPTQLHDQLFDTYAEGPGLGLGGHCDDVLDTDGNATLNGFPLQCPRAESSLASRIGTWFPIAAVNRFDLAPTDGANCGEARLVFANPGPGRAFVIFEAKIPNPDPGCGLSACAPVQEFWASLSAVDNPEKRADMLHQAFISGHAGLAAAGFGPFVRARNFGVGAGQIRTNNFVQGPWTLREFKLVSTFSKPSPPVPRVRAVQVPVAANPFGTIFDESAKLPLGEKCREAFLATGVQGLMNDDVNLMSVDMPLKCLAAESANNFSNRYDLRLTEDGEFWGQIEARIADLDPTSNLTPRDIARRAAFAGACIGCHQETNGIELGNTVFAPLSDFFVHTNEFSNEACGDGTTDCFLISTAVRDSFLPHREAVMEQFLGDSPCCGPGGLDVGFDDAQPIDPFEVMQPAELADLDPAGIAEAEAEADANVSPQTVGGALGVRAH